jgi:branched-chain amino acid transport system ATP-binding protein
MKKMLLEVRGLCVNYGHIEAIRDISFDVEEGTVATLIGANGAGKTTTLKTISGLRKVRAGQIIFDGEDITHLPPYERVMRGLSQSPEGRGCFPGMTVLENLDMGAFVRKDRKTSAYTADLDRVFDLFPRLKEREKQMAGSMSGGEQQMLAIGRALMAKPRLVLLDEPSMGLAPKLIQQIFTIITEINAQGTTRRRHSSAPTPHTSSRPARSSGPAPVPNWLATIRCARRISAEMSSGTRPRPRSVRGLSAAPAAGRRP